MFDNFIEFISNELFDIWQIACLVESKWISRHHKYISIKTRRIKYLFVTIILIYYYRLKQIDGITFDLRMMSICLVSNKTKQINKQKKHQSRHKTKNPKENWAERKIVASMTTMTTNMCTICYLNINIINNNTRERHWKCPVKQYRPFLL